MEYNPMEEMGFVEEKQLIMASQGPLSTNFYVRDLCERAIRDGGRFFDIISRYSDLIVYVVGRDNAESPNPIKMVIPFLKAFGMTDHQAYEFAKEDLKISPGAEETVGYLKELLPTYVATGTYIHDVMAISEATEFPYDSFTCTKVDFDSIDIDRQEARELRAMASKIVSLKIPRIVYSSTEAMLLDEKDAKIITELDKIFVDRLPKMEIWKSYGGLLAIGAQAKAYAMLEIRRKTSIEFHSTAFVGSEMNDHQALDLIRDSEGLAISYNGSEYAVRGANIAVMSSNAIVLAVLVGEFYNEGIQAVYDMVDNWNRDYLKNSKCSDRNLMNRMLAAFPKKLPVVKRVTRDNVDEIVDESEAYRKKVLR